MTNLANYPAASPKLVKHDGRRFHDEETWDEIAFCDAALAAGGGPVWAIFDSEGAVREGWTKLEPPVVEPGYFFSGALEELATAVTWQGASVPATALAETVYRYNRFVDGGADLEFGRPTPTRKIVTALFYAAWATPVVHDPCSGLRVNERCEVIDIHGEVIAGLYAGVR